MELKRNYAKQKESNERYFYQYSFFFFSKKESVITSNQFAGNLLCACKNFDLQTQNEEKEEKNSKTGVRNHMRFDREF